MNVKKIIEKYFDKFFHKHKWKIIRWRYNNVGAFFHDLTMYCPCGKTKSEKFLHDFRGIVLTEEEFLKMDEDDSHYNSMTHKEHLRIIRDLK